MTYPFTDFLPNKDSNLQLFTGSAVSGTFFTYHVPDTATMLYITCVGGGGGGGGAAVNGFSSSGGSGGGGGGAVCKLIVPAIMLPSVLFIRPGLGGSGGIPAFDGNPGNSSYVLILPDTTLTPQNILCASGAVAAGGGFEQIPGNGGVPGTGETIITASTAVLYQYGLICGGVTNAVAGAPGRTGGLAGANAGVASTYPSSSSNLLTSGGAGGGGGSSGGVGAGGAVTGLGVFPSMVGGIGHTGTNTQVGGPGSQSSSYNTTVITPFISLPGSGGGGCFSSTSSTGQSSGGLGGDGGLGSGGGGAGSSSTSGISNGSTGGDGGNGYVLIQAV